MRNGWSVPPSVCPPSHEWILALEREREREKTTPLSKQKVRVDPSDLLSLDNGDNSWQPRTLSSGRSAQVPLQPLSSALICVAVSDSTMCSGGKYCLFLFLLQSSLSDPATTNQGEREARRHQPGCATFLFFSQSNDWKPFYIKKKTRTKKQKKTQGKYLMHVRWILDSIFP